MNLVTRSFKGQASLAFAFWIMFIGISLLLRFILGMLISRRNPELINSPMISSLLNGIALPYTLFAAVCVWRCGRNSNLFWRIVSRVIIVLAVIGGIFALMKLI